MLFGDRSLDDSQDVFRCLDANLGLELWTVEYPAEGKLDYGNSPRATPLVDGDRVFLFGAFGDLHCVNLISGEILWKRNLRKEFEPDAEMPWGYSGSPLLVGRKLIVNPGAKSASLAALDPATGKVIWKSPGAAVGHGSFIAGRFGGKLQIVGHDADSLGGWDPETGNRLWRLEPPEQNDFNVPTPIDLGGKLLVTTENNGTRIYDFRTDGTIIPDPIAQNERLNPDTSTPVIVGDRLFCVHKLLWCLDWKEGLKEVWKTRDPAVSSHGAIIASDDRLLVIADGELLLVDAKADKPTIISRVKVFEEKVRPYSHPALVGSRLYLRGENRLKCLDLSQQEEVPIGQ